MKPKDTIKILTDNIKQVEPSVLITDDPNVNYTPYISFEKAINNFATMAFRIHVSKRHKYIKIDNNAYVRIQCLDEIFPSLEDFRSMEIGKIYYYSLKFFEKFLNQKLVSEIELLDDGTQNLNEAIESYAKTYINDYAKVFFFIQNNLTLEFLKSKFQDYKNIIYANGDSYKLIIPTKTNDKLIELAGLYLFNPDSLSISLALLKGLASNESDDIARNRYNKLLKEICEVKKLDFETYKSSDSPTTYFSAKIKTKLYKTFNKYQIGLG